MILIGRAAFTPMRGLSIDASSADVFTIGEAEIHRLQAHMHNGTIIGARSAQHVRAAQRA